MNTYHAISVYMFRYCSGTRHEQTINHHDLQTELPGYYAVATSNRDALTGYNRQTSQCNALMKW